LEGSPGGGCAEFLEGAAFYGLFSDHPPKITSARERVVTEGREEQMGVGGPLAEFEVLMTDEIDTPADLTLREGSRGWPLEEWVFVDLENVAVSWGESNWIHVLLTHVHAGWRSLRALG
jgi:hypothetical protein